MLQTHVDTGFSERLPLVGREAEVRRLSEYLHDRVDRHFVYYWGLGGLGKTRLLHEVQRLVLEARGRGEDYRSSGLIDLYHTDVHSNSDVERAIVDGLDPEGAYFKDYRRDRKHYQWLREQGATPEILEQYRRRLSKLFVRECNDLADRVRKVVLCFDTLELLQHESSLVEERAGLDAVDTLLKPWLLSTLPKLHHVLVVLAGRPRVAMPDERRDPQERFLAELKSAFRDDLVAVELPPFTLEETGQFVRALPGGEENLPASYWPIVHRLTEGRPIFLHLTLDLLGCLSEEPRQVLARFDRWQELADVAEKDPRLIEARKLIKTEILGSIFNSAGPLGGYLGRLALMPKGFDPGILKAGLGLPESLANQLIERLNPLSFVKVHNLAQALETADGTVQTAPHLERMYLHDEMYSLLAWPQVMPNLRMNEIQVAYGLVTNYYDPEIARLEQEIAGAAGAEYKERVLLRERLQKLQVERMYYLLISDPKAGYAIYHSLSDQANRDRQVGFGMRLLDEFLRFYASAERRRQLAATGIDENRVLRESALLWVERFHWRAKYEDSVRFAQQVLDAPPEFAIDPAEHAALLGNVAALWARGRTLLHGYEQATAERADGYLKQLPGVAETGDPAALVARARLATSIGFEYDEGGELNEAIKYYGDAHAAFRKLEGYADEQAMLLNNLAYVYARQGHFVLARSHTDRALQLCETQGSEYSLALTLSTRATIEIMRESFLEAVEYGRKALERFEMIEDAHGTVLAEMAIATATRKAAKAELQLGRQLEEDLAQFTEAAGRLEAAYRVAVDKHLEGLQPQILAELGKAYRELGRVAESVYGLPKAREHFRRSEDDFRKALASPKLNRVERADTLVDLAEGLFAAGFAEEALKSLDEAAEIMGVTGSQAAAPRASEYFRPLGKADRLRGKLNMARGDVACLQHFARAYEAFDHFSSSAQEKEAMIQLLYADMRRLEITVDMQRDMMQALRGWAKESGAAPQVHEFVEILRLLLGV